MLLLDSLNAVLTTSCCQVKPIMDRDIRFENPSAREEYDKVRTLSLRQPERCCAVPEGNSHLDPVAIEEGVNISTEIVIREIANISSNQ